MAKLEEIAVFQYLTCDHRVFVCPQFEVPDGKSPDFAVLDFRRSGPDAAETPIRHA